MSPGLVWTLSSFPPRVEAAPRHHRVEHLQHSSTVPISGRRRQIAKSIGKAIPPAPVPEDVRCDAVPNAGAPGPVLDDELSATGGQPLAVAEVEKYRLAGPAPQHQLAPSIQRLDRGLADRNRRRSRSRRGPEAGTAAGRPVSLFCAIGFSLKLTIY